MAAKQERHGTTSGAYPFHDGTRRVCRMLEGVSYSVCAVCSDQQPGADDSGHELMILWMHAQSAV